MGDADGDLTGHAGRVRRAPAGQAVEVLALAALYELVSSGVSTVGTLPGNVTPVWPATGLALWAVLVRGRSLLSGVALGELSFNLLHGTGALASSGMALGNVVEVAVAASLIRRTTHLPSLRASRDVTALIVLGALASTWLAAVIGVGSLVAAGEAPASGAGRSILVWWAGDALGILVVTPVLISIANGRLRTRPTTEQLVQLAVGIALDVAVFSHHQRYSTVGYPIVLWAALRLGEAWTALTGLVVTVIAVVFTAAGSGPFVQSHDVRDLWLLATFLVVMAVTGLVTAAVVAERNDATASLRSSVAGLEERVWDRTADLLRDQQALSDAQHLARLGSWTWDVRSDTVTWSEGMRALFPSVAGPPVLADYLGMVHPEDRDALNLAIGRCMETGLPYELEHRVITNGEVRWLHCSGSVVRTPDGEASSLQGTAQDITTRRRAEMALRESEEQFRLLAVNSTDIISRTDPQGRLVYTSPSVERVLGHSAGELVGRTLLELVHPSDHRVIMETWASMASGGSAVTVPHRMRHLDGGWVWVESVMRVVRDADGEPVEVHAASRDITARREAEVALQASELLLAHQATHDPLTDLANRTLLLERLSDALPSASLLFIDLDHFKEVNDSWGHVAGDQALRLTASRLLMACPASATVARIGGDEFVVLLPTADVTEVEAAAHRVSAVLAEPAELDGRKLVRLGASVGVAAARAGSTAESMLRDADSALYEAKHSGRGRVIVFDDPLRDRDALRNRVESDLRIALDERRVTVHFQPMVALADGSTVGAEALLRIQDPVLGPHLPDLLFEVAEGSGIILDVGARVLAQSCGVAARWPDQDSFVSVNVSAREVTHPAFAHGVIATLEATGLAPERLWIEVTERTLVDSEAETLHALRELSERGIRIGIDDFGTGYSSVTYLRTLPVSFLKIDRSFVIGLGRDDRDTAVVRAILDLAGSIGITTIGEGVETAEQAEHLTRLGCQIGQGFWWARPVPFVELGWGARTCSEAPRESLVHQPG